MNKKQRQTLNKVLTTPVRSDIEGDDVVSLFEALGAVISQGRGSRVRVVLNGVKAVFHEPHPEKEINKGAVRAIREFLEKANVSLDDYGI